MAERGDLTKTISEFMARSDYRPATIRDLMRLMRVPKDRRNDFKRAFRELQSEGQVVKLDRNRYAAGTARAAPISGRLQRHPRGFGFVTPDAGGRDIYIPAHALGDLMNGDRVTLRVVHQGHDGRARGEIVGVIERSRRPVLGIYRSQGGSRGLGYVEAYDRLFETPILIPEGSAGPAKNGMVVGVQVTRPPSEGQQALGRVIELLGPPDDPGTDLKAIIMKFDLREKFAADVIEEAERVPEEVQEEERRGREDFRQLPIVTIDGETARDFDDAVHVLRHDDGTWELQVHIADVAHYVRPRSALDREAYERGTSVYFPGTALPMLPPRLSSGICSLNPGVDRLVQSCLMTIDRQGSIVDARFTEGVIRSAARMTYTEVAKILVDGDPGTSERYRDLVPGFRLMEELCGLLGERRRRRGSIDFDLPEPEVILAMTGEMTGIVALERNVAHRLIEEFMLAANQTVARHLFRAKVPSVYRIHERPDPRRVEEFDRIARAFGYRLPQPFITLEPEAFQALLESLKGKPEERFLSRLMLRAMKQARYAPERDIHFGLAMTCYTHFTSPIRRYPDLIVHRLLRRVLQSSPLAPRERDDLEGFLPEATLHSSRMERNADAAENELVEWKKMAYMADRVGEEFDGVIISLQPYGFFVELREMFIDGLVRLESIPDDRYQFIETKQILKGERHGRVFKLGEPVRVRVDRVNRFLLQIDFSLAEAGGAPEPRSSGPPGAPSGAAGRRSQRGRRSAAARSPGHRRRSGRSGR